MLEFGARKTVKFTWVAHSRARRGAYRILVCRFRTRRLRESGTARGYEIASSWPLGRKRVIAWWSSSASESGPCQTAAERRIGSICGCRLRATT